MDPKERFYRKFHLQVAAITDSIGRLGSFTTVGGERKDATNSVLASISKLSHDVADAAEYIPAYDQRLYFEAVKALTDRLNEELARSAPKARFQFKRTAKPSASVVTGGREAGTTTANATDKEADPRLLRGILPRTDASASPAAATSDDAFGALPPFAATKNYNVEMTAGTPAGGGIRKPSFSAAREIAISDHTGLHIILPLSAARATASGSLTDLRDCVVDMSVPTAASASGDSGDGGRAFLSLVLKNIDHSLVVVGHVNGPVHITGLRDSIVVVASQQVRIHECSNVDLYLHSGSRPIIEDCHGMRFAPLPACYINEDDEKTTNQWDQVDDFKWLKADHSPNWCVLPEDERLSETVWTGAVAGGPGLATEDVLRAVGIGKV